MTDDLLIERLAVRAWPALVTQQTGGWLLRSTPGVGRRRSNSAVPPVEGALDGLPEVEDFYRQRDVDVLIQVTPEHRHTALDAQLAERGYSSATSTLVLRAALSDRDLESPRFQVELGAREERWMRTHVDITGKADASGELVMDRIPGQTVFATALEAGTVLGVGAGVLEDGWLGVYAMGTLPAHRRRGVGVAVLTALLAWGSREGAHSAWLQVEADNAPAQALYEANGFAFSHRYHYRVQSRAR